jgi:hypothetical protein
MVARVICIDCRKKAVDIVSDVVVDNTQMFEACFEQGWLFGDLQYAKSDSREGGLRATYTGICPDCIRRT